MSPADVMQSFRWVKQTLQQLAVKHRALKLVGEQCRLYQQKWQASGPLAMLDASGLTQALRALDGPAPGRSRGGRLGLGSSGGPGLFRPVGQRRRTAGSGTISSEIN